MMSEYIDHYHRWEALAEFHFSTNDQEYDDEDEYTVCLCSRVLTRDVLRTYYADKEASESDNEAVEYSQEWDQSHVHFSLDTSNKERCEKDEGASCYCSASHTENYCSTDEHDPAQLHGNLSHALQPSDSGADLTYQDYHSDHTHEKPEPMTLGTMESNEDYSQEDTWDKFWSVNGERLIWASWIAKYSDYINPAYLNDNNDLTMNEINIPKQLSADQINKNFDIKMRIEEDSIRERKYSYDSKVNPYKKCKSSSVDKSEILPVQDDTWLAVGRRRSYSEHIRMVSPRTVDGTDSMTNVTKITLSSYDVTSSHVTSESTPTDDYSMSSSTSDDQSHDKTRILNVDDNLDNMPIEETDPEQYWQFLWKQHFGDQYALHYANYVQSHPTTPTPVNLEATMTSKMETLNVEPTVKLEKRLDIECENSEGNSQEMPSVIEVLQKVDNISLKEKVTKRKRNTRSKVTDSVGMLLQNLLKEEKLKNESNEVTEAGDGNESKTDDAVIDVKEETGHSNVNHGVESSNVHSYSYDDGDDEPPDQRPVSLKRSHEIDDEEDEPTSSIRSTMEVMGYTVNTDNLPQGQLVYRKRFSRLRGTYRTKGARKTYFDDEGNAYQCEQTPESNEDGAMQTEDDCKLDSNTKTDDTMKQESVEATRIASDDTGEREEQIAEEKSKSADVQDTKRRRRPKRRHDTHDVTHEITEMPAELRDDHKMIKYWKKRHSLFHRFDDGIKLDKESWFSVTPENVAKHIASKCACDVIVDAFCGAGGNTIQFAFTCQKVIAIDIDPAKIEMAKHNASIYGVADRIEFIVGDFFEIAPTLTADMVFLSPPWGGPQYIDNDAYDIETMLEPRSASELMNFALEINSRVALYVPRNSSVDQLVAIGAKNKLTVELEQSYLDRRFVAITAYYYNIN